MLMRLIGSNKSIENSKRALISFMENMSRSGHGLNKCLFAQELLLSLKIKKSTIMNTSYLKKQLKDLLSEMTFVWAT